ncbi:MAG: DUF1778 domain-containing protein [Blastocatellia bacterium]
MKTALVMSVLTETNTLELARLHFRLPQEAKEVIERAALVSGLTVTDFAIASLVESAHETLNRQTQRQLSDRDRDLFLKMLDDNSEPNEALKQSARRYKRRQKT